MVGPWDTYLSLALYPLSLCYLMKALEKLSAVTVYYLAYWNWCWMGQAYRELLDGDELRL